MISRAKAIAWLLVVVACLACCDNAAARAGGGGGFGGGGGGGGFGGGGFGGGGFGGGFSGGGGFSSGGGSGEFSPLGFGIFIAAVILIVVAKAIQEHQRNRFSGGSGDGIQYAASRHDQSVAETTLQASDPHFKAEGFLARMSDAFMQIQDAWQNHDMGRVRHFVSDSIFERFSLQIQEQQDAGYRDHMEQITIQNAMLAEATLSHAFEVLTVQVVASAIDYRVSLDSGEHVSGSRSPEHFTEFWSFVRRRGVQTTEDKPGLIEGSCPNCGTPIDINRAQRCASCDALLRSGEYDWVLAEITQGCVWTRRSREELEMAEQYRERCDPGFNIQHLEDRTSVIFWRKAMADRLGDVRPLMKMATDELCMTYEAEYRRQTPDGERQYRGACAVGSVDLRGIVEADEADFALLVVHWSSNLHGVTPTGEVRDHGKWRRYRTLYVLMRHKGVRTNVDRAIHSAHCPTCGAPESDLASHACEFCETVLNDGRQDWVLAECHSMHTSAAEDWLAKARPAPPPTLAKREDPAQFVQRELALSHADVLAWTVNVFAADKSIDRRERRVIGQLAKKQQMPEPMAAGLIDAALAGELEAPAPPTPAIGRVWMEHMADVALLDGEVQPDERETLVELGRKAGLAGVDVNLMINKRRAERHRMARQASR